MENSRVTFNVYDKNFVSDQMVMQICFNFAFVQIIPCCITDYCYVENEIN